MPPRFLLPLAALTACALAQENSAAPPTPAQLDFFEKKIRPVLVDHCYKCHSEQSDKIKGGLVLDTRDGIRRGGDNGPAVVRGQSDESLLIQAIRYAHRDFAMPPEKSGGKLPDAVIADFEAWIQMGAPDPRDGPARVVKKFDAAEARRWWSFQPPRKTEPPAVQDASWPRGAIDRFILAGLEEKGLTPSADADRTTLLRRVYFDLIGLPPTLQQIDDFLQDTSPGALARVVDELLAQPQFGERWGRHWLDVARYAESSGRDVNIAYPHAWRYRDYVIAAFNEDKPYDRFLREQIAGDLLPAPDDREKAANLVATGLLAVGSKPHNEQNPRQFFLDVADEQLDTVSQAVLGMTIACARCHDHKFDPISQRDYYALAGIFLSTETRYGTAVGLQNRHPSGLLELPAAAAPAVLERRLAADDRARKEKQLQALQEEQRKLFTDRLGTIRASGGRAENAPPVAGTTQLRLLQLISQGGLLDVELKSFAADGTPRPLAMGVRDLPKAQGSGPGNGFGRRTRPGVSSSAAFGLGRYSLARPAEFTAIRDSALYARGESDKPGERVPRGFPALLTAGPAPEIPAGTSGRRELAEWLASTQNPLTARVFVNRTWHWLFGRGLVVSCDNFGTTGATPANQALLDTLAVRFAEGGWKIKALIREIVLSRAYGQSSAYDAQAFQADPENTLIWRANRRRLEAECLRDAMLAASGQLQLQPPVGSVIALNGDGPIGGPRRQNVSPGSAGPARRPLLAAGAANTRGYFGGATRVPGTAEESIVEAAGPYRSVYLPIARGFAPDSLAVFDFVDSTLVTGVRESTNVPSQALYLLNSDFVAGQAQHLAERILRAYPAGPNGASARFDERLLYAYWLVFNRAPNAAEKNAATTFFSRYPATAASEDEAAGNKTAWTSFSRALFSAAEFRYLP